MGNPWEDMLANGKEVIDNAVNNFNDGVENFNERIGFINGSGRQDFVGVDVGAARNYIEHTLGKSIKDAIDAAKDTKKVFTTLSSGWSGVATANFQTNFSTGVQKLEKSLAKAFAALVKEVAAITDAMVEQDINMVEKQ